MTDKTVTQADRDRFAEYLEAHGRPATATEMRAGRMDDDDGLLMLARHRLAQSDAQMAAPDALAAELAALDAKAYPAPWCWEQCGDKEDAPVIGAAWWDDDGTYTPIAGEVDGNSPDNVDRHLYRECIAYEMPGHADGAASANARLIVALRNNLPAILASLSASNDSNVMRDALTKARRELYLLSLNEGARDHEIGVLITQIDAALAGQGTTLDRQTVEQAMLDRVAELREDEPEAGFWRACSGCQESNEGVLDTHIWPHSKVFNVQPGSGCHECGGLGVLWDDTDYEKMARASMDQSHVR